MAGETVTLYADNMTVTIPGAPDSTHENGLMLAEDGVEGWYSTPLAKVSLTERGQGNGAHDVSRDDILYAARTVVTHFIVLADDERRTIVDSLNTLCRMSGRMVRMTFDDGGLSTYVTGYLTVENSDTQWSRSWNGDNTFTLVCPRPERLSSSAQRYQLWPAVSSDGGLWYGDARKGLTFPLRFGTRRANVQNRCVLSNRGSSRAYPTYELHGYWPNGCLLSFDGNRFVQFKGLVQTGSPVVLDTRSRTASCDGVDVSQYLTLRDFPTVPPAGSLSVTLMGSGANGSGVVVTGRDTYM